MVCSNAGARGLSGAKASHLRCLEGACLYGAVLSVCAALPRRLTHLYNESQLQQLSPWHLKYSQAVLTNYLL